MCMYYTSSLLYIWDSLPQTYQPVVRRFDEEITTHSQDFLYLNILVSSVKLAQELILLFNIRDYNIRLAPA